jgi:hypothetical protein
MICSMPGCQTTAGCQCRQWTPGRDIRIVRMVAADDAEQMRTALERIRDEAATMENGGAWAAGLATLCLGTLSK